MGSTFKNRSVPSFHFDSFLIFLYFRSKFIRLKHENKMLKLQIEGNENEKIQVLQSMLDDLKEQKNELETENRYCIFSSF